MVVKHHLAVALILCLIVHAAAEINLDTLEDTESCDGLFLAAAGACSAFGHTSKACVGAQSDLRERCPLGMRPIPRDANLGESSELSLLDYVKGQQHGQQATGKKMNLVELQNQCNALATLGEQNEETPDGSGNITSASAAAASASVSEGLVRPSQPALIDPAKPPKLAFEQYVNETPDEAGNKNCYYSGLRGISRPSEDLYTTNLERMGQEPMTDILGAPMEVLVLLVKSMRLHFCGMFLPFLQDIRDRKWPKDIIEEALKKLQAPIVNKVDAVKNIVDSLSGGVVKVIRRQSLVV